MHASMQLSCRLKALYLCLYLGFLRTRMTESPLMKSLGMKRSLLTGVEPFLPLPVLGICTQHTLYQAKSALLLAHLT